MVFKEKAYSIIEVMIGLSIMGIVGSSVVTLVGNKMNEHRLNSLQNLKRVSPIVRIFRILIPII